MIKISCVRYLNSQPFVYGLKNNSIINDIELSLDTPSDCAEKLLNGTVDIGLIPVAVIPALKESHIISDYCIGADGKVETVLLLSDVPLNEIKNVFARLPVADIRAAGENSCRQILENLSAVDRRRK
jgi:chorismate dehydratase